ncbi:hypothetical protein BC826DRAFT_967893 [Russula brevipes]|nr:hypothetical protein BC826DRAFT_967893 [Russula brevipes]
MDTLSMDGKSSVHQYASVPVPVSVTDVVGRWAPLSLLLPHHQHSITLPSPSDCDPDNRNANRARSSCTKELADQRLAASDQGPPWWAGCPRKTMAIMRANEARPELLRERELGPHRNGDAVDSYQQRHQQQRDGCPRVGAVTRRAPPNLDRVDPGEHAPNLARRLASTPGLNP